jgi:MFS family permease
MATLRPAASFWTAAAVIVLSQWGGAAPSVVYPLYAQQWGLTTIVTTTVFAVYPVALAVVLALFGGISDAVGRRAALLIGLALMGIGGLVFALAPSVAWLYVGRLAQGAGVGVALGAASAALVDFNTSPNPARASSVNTMSSSLGLVASVVIGGALVQYAPSPMRLSFWLLLLLIVVALAFASLMPRRDRFDPEGRPDTSAGWRPRPIGVPGGTRRIFLASAFSGFVGLGLGSIILSLGAQIAKSLIHTDSALVQGLILGISAVLIGVVGLAARFLSPRTSAIAGGLTAAASILLFIPAASQHSIALYVISQVLGGAGMGFSLLGGIGYIHRYAPAHHRGQLISAFYLACYVAQGLISTFAGLAATEWGLQSAINVFAPIIAVIGVMATLVAITMRTPSTATPVRQAVTRQPGRDAPRHHNQRPDGHRVQCDSVAEPSK